MLKLSPIIVGVLVTMISIFAVSCSNKAQDSSDEKRTYNSKGTVKTVDPHTLKVSIDHQDIPGFMSAMEMTFDAANASLLSGIAVGDKVAFVLERSGGKATLTSITRTNATEAADGAVIFASNCAECHGHKGEGKKKGIPLISGHALAHSEKEFVEQVVNGKDKKMPAFREKLSDEEIAAVVKYVRTVIQSGLKPDPKHEH